MAAKIYQLKITLQGSSKPPIWRQVLVASEINFQELHAIIQGAMGWTNSHLHAFTDRKRSFSIGIPEDEDFGMMEVTDGRKKKISTLLKKENDQLLYEYDFGDGWEHTIELQKILPADDKLSYPYLLTGKGKCPPEDCGGIWGYYNMVKAINDPKHPEHDDFVEWTDFEHWDTHELNLELHREETWDAFKNAKDFYG